jgi:pyrroline-5-carboxylate reductase
LIFVGLQRVRRIKILNEGTVFRLRKQTFVLGAGAMAEAFIRGVTKAGVIDPRDIAIINRGNADRLRRLVDRYGVRAASGYADAAHADQVMVAVKPTDVREAMSQLAPHLNVPLLVSFVAGVSIECLQQYAGDRARIVRTMPNLAVAVGEGVTAVAYGPGVTEEERAYVVRMLQSLGQTVELPEHLLDAATALSGSGPGFLCYVLEAMVDAAKELGIPANLAEEMVVQTMAGTARTLMARHLPPAELRRLVTSPNGTTHAGISAMQQLGLPLAVKGGILRAAARSREMGEQFKAGLHG